MPEYDQSFRAIVSRVYLNAGSQLDANHAEALRDRIERAFDKTNDVVMLVCTQVQFVDTGGLRTLLEMQRQAENRGIRLIVVNPSRPLRDLLALTGLVDAVDIDEQTRPSGEEEHHTATGSPMHGFPVPDLPNRVRTADHAAS